jgi:hypothetical protein
MSRSLEFCHNVLEYTRNRRMRSYYFIIAHDSNHERTSLYLIVAIRTPWHWTAFRIKIPGSCINDGFGHSYEGVYVPAHRSDNRRHMFLTISRDRHALVRQTGALRSAQYHSRWTAAYKTYTRLQSILTIHVRRNTYASANVRSPSNNSSTQ